MLQANRKIFKDLPREKKRCCILIEAILICTMLRRQNWAFHLWIIPVQKTKKNIGRSFSPWVQFDAEERMHSKPCFLQNEPIPLANKNDISRLASHHQQRPKQSLGNISAYSSEQLQISQKSWVNPRRFNIQKFSYLFPLHWRNTMSSLSAANIKISPTTVSEVHCPASQSQQVLWWLVCIA